MKHYTFCIINILFFLILGTPNTNSQTVLSLKECINYAIENNLHLKSAHIKEAQNVHTISENQSKLYPNVSGFVSFNDNFNPPVSATDQSANGSPYHITHTLQYSTGMGFQLNMNLYNQAVLSSIKLVKQTTNLNTLNLQKIQEDIILNVAQLYLLAQTTNEQIKLIDNNIQNLSQLRNLTKTYLDNGMILEVDLQRIDLNLNNLNTTKENAELFLQQQYNSLKFIMDYPAEKKISVEPCNIFQATKSDATGLSILLPELQILEQYIDIAQSQLQVTRDNYLPSIALTGFMQWNAWTGDLKRWGGGYPDNKLWNSYGIGLTLKIPIFDGMSKHAKIKKGELNIQDSRVKYQYAQRDFQTKYDNALLQRECSYTTLMREKEAYSLAQNVYKITSYQYTEGVTSMSDVLQDQMNINQARASYINAYINFKMANLSIIKLTGQIHTLAK